MTARRTSTPSPDLLALLDAWLPARRWYPVKGVAVRHEPWMSFALDVPSPPPPGTGDVPAGTRVDLHLVRLVGEGVDLVVQVPLVLVPAGTARATTPGPAPIGELVEDGATWAVHDGAAHPACWAALLAAATWDLPDPTDDGDPAGPRVDLTDGRALSVEQSNSSVLLPATAGGTMLKVLRAIAVGPNPDVTIPHALARQLDRRAPSARVARGHVGRRRRPRPRPAHPVRPPRDPRRVRPGRSRRVRPRVLVRRPGGLLRRARGRPRTRARRPARRAAGGVRRRAARGRPVARRRPAPPVRRGGRVVARARPARRRDRGVLGPDGRAAGRGRARPRRPAAAADRARRPAPRQVLHARRFGWKVLDFEGEPLRPVAERTRPDLALRDVAGVVRSFDYAAAVGSAPDPGWAVQARTAFLEAYERADTAGVDAATTQALVRALTLDKALYEVVYESRNRPDWEPIPLAAVDRLLAGAG
ncbi:hypothetical protein [Cellulosimicrobium sp. CUA-896]|uniref:hypothetical protein n=1 Tax=Cellulosimicrobium sp. CUA-896 TaxID=1517881 RepID=UPI0021013DF4|nr:hypothetical protein [Cellulosimicrobium sp. CUA-896]